MNKQKGITMIEVLVTLLVTTVGLLGLAALQLKALQATADSGQRSQAVWLMQDLIESMRANPKATDANYRQAVTCNNTPAQCAPTPGGVTSTECNAEQMAYFNLWESQCSYADPSSNDVYTSRDALIAAEGKNSIISLSSTSSGDMTATAEWFYKGSADITTSGIPKAQEIVR